MLSQATGVLFTGFTLLVFAWVGVRAAARFDLADRDLDLLLVRAREERRVEAESLADRRRELSRQAPKQRERGGVVRGHGRAQRPHAAGSAAREQLAQHSAPEAAPAPRNQPS